MSEQFGTGRESGPEPIAARRHQEHFFAEMDETGLGAVDAVQDTGAPSSLWSEAWHKLRRRPLFWVSTLIITVVMVVALFPSWFTSVDPRFCELSNSLGERAPGHLFGFDRQGCDIFSRTMYGARASVLVGVLTTIAVVVIGVTVGALAGFVGGWADTLLSRVTDIFFAIPLVLAAIVVMQVFSDSRSMWTVIAVLGVFGWPPIARITRGTVMSIKNNDYITAATALGVSRVSTLLRHILPNAAAPIIVYATVALGTFIVAEATLSFLGIGLPPSVTSWGGDISKAQASLRSNATVLFYPAGALAMTVLGFIMLGDVVRDALDPKVRNR